MLSILVPLIAALLFPLAAMALKRAMESAEDPWGVVLASNWAATLVFLPLFAAEGKPGEWERAWQPLACGALFFAAQAAAYKSFATGDLSVAVPAQGTKVLLVAGLTVLLLGVDVGPWLWGAAFLTLAAIWLLQESADGGDRKSLWLTLAYALLASAAFAAFDVLVQKWSPAWGAARFGAWVFLVQGALSASLFALPGCRLRHGARTWAWLAPGALAMALITLALVLTIGYLGKAALVNVLFNSRAVWSVILIWSAGRWFGNREARAGGPALRRRLAGAGAMLAAVLMATLG